MIHRFDGFSVDDELFELRRDGVLVPIQRRAFDLLVYLVRHRNVVVSKAELLRTVWADVVVSNDALTQAMKLVRDALGDAIDEPSFVQTVRGRGYRFIAYVEA